MKESQEQRFDRELEGAVASMRQAAYAQGWFDAMKVCGLEMNKVLRILPRDITRRKPQRSDPP